jgi:hypothetical protein
MGLVTDVDTIVIVFATGVVPRDARCTILIADAKHMLLAAIGL